MKHEGINIKSKNINWTDVYSKIKENEKQLMSDPDKEIQLKRKILKNRAKQISKEHEMAADNQEKIQVLAFVIGSETYAVEIEYVTKVYMLKDLTPLPGVPDYIAGIINVRGSIVPVIDFKKLCNIESTGKIVEKVIVLSADDSCFALMADEVMGLNDLRVNDIQHDLLTLTGSKAEYLKGITNHQWGVLDPIKISTHKSIMINHERIDE